MLTPEFLAASMIALGIGARRESAARVPDVGRAAPEAGLEEVRSRRGRRTRKRGVPAEGCERR
ncbi:MAG TPA: hypothetical protein VML91_08250 [Burkholderiales bacterium]|nr:hypothetical protein [Burkholderiales bacterium]